LSPALSCRREESIAEEEQREEEEAEEPTITEPGRGQDIGVAVF